MVALSFLPLALLAQDAIYDELTRPYVTRPSTLKAGYFEINGAYSHLLASNYYNAEGAKLEYSEMVRSILQDQIQFSFSYGLNDFLMIRGNMGYTNRKETSPTYYVFNGEGFSEDERLYQYRGISKLNIGGRIRTPAFLSERLQIFLDADAYIPISAAVSPLPKHKITYLDPSDPGSVYQMDYHYILSPFTPGFEFQFALGAYYNTDKLGGGAWFGYRNTSSLTDAYYWNQTNYGSTFIYQQVWYQLQPKGAVQGEIQFDYQLFPWFALLSRLNYFGETAGWTAITGERVRLEPTMLMQLVTGFDLQVSTHLRIAQYLHIPLTGVDRFSEFQVSIGLIYAIYQPR